MIDSKNRLLEAVSFLEQADYKMAAVIRNIGQLNISTGENSIKSMINIIISQQLSYEAAKTIRRRLYDFINEDDIIEAIVKLGDKDISHIGLSQRKAAFIRGIACGYRSGEIDFGRIEKLDDVEAAAYLCRINGIGQWSAEMYLIFSMNRLDVFPVSDKAIRKAISIIYKTEGTEKNVSSIAENWRPYRSIASRYLYAFLNNHNNKDKVSKSEGISNPYD